MSAERTAPAPGTLFGHPTGLFALFFAEMWERFSYYGMRALLLFYMIKGFLAYSDKDAYAVYGAYTAMVYATPFIGGMLADRLLGARRAVVLGGLLMAAGHLLMTVENQTAFFVALALLICGNGFFKPNISTIVGSLYPEGSTKRDSGFTIFYIGINLGAAMSPLLCGYVGETVGWHYGFGLATIGMLVGLAVFVAPVRVTQVLILLGAFGTAISLVLIPDNVYLIAVNVFVGAALVVAGVVAFVALGRGGVPDEAGRPPRPERLAEPAMPKLQDRALLNPYYLAIIAAGLLLQYVVMPESDAGIAVACVGLAAIIMPWISAGRAVYVGVAAAIPIFAILVQRNEVAGVLLIVFGLFALGSLFFEALRSPKVERERLYVVLILMFFSMLFWSFFEQAGSSVNNFTDRNVDRVAEARVVAADEVGKAIDVTLTQEQLGYTHGALLVTMDVLQQARDADQKAREAQKDAEAKGPTEAAPPRAVEVKWNVSEDDVGMGVAEEGAEVPASVFQSANPIFIILFGLLFTALWAFLGKRGLEPNIPVKFALGLAQLGLGFGAFWYGAQMSDERGMVWVGWLLIGYLLQTTGELCLSPVGLSMVTRLSPRRIVSTVMGAWFLATAFSNYLAGAIASLTGIEEGGDFPRPSETVHVYGDVFYQICVAALISAAVLFALSPILKRWMHTEAEHAPDEAES